jgi:uncharacterized membrane protein
MFSDLPPELLLALGTVIALALAFVISFTFD